MRTIRTRLALALFLAGACAPLATAAPRSIADCEQIRQADAYNACLAAFGPSVPGLATREKMFARGEAIPDTARPARRSFRHVSRQRRRGRRGATQIHRSGGRVRMVIDVKHR